MWLQLMKRRNTERTSVPSHSNLEGGSGSVTDGGRGCGVGSRSLLLGFRGCSFIGELQEGLEGMDSVRKAQEKSTGRKYIRCVGCEAAVAP